MTGRLPDDDQHIVPADDPPPVDGSTLRQLELSGPFDSVVPQAEEANAQHEPAPQPRSDAPSTPARRRRVSEARTDNSDTRLRRRSSSAEPVAVRPTRRIRGKTAQAAHPERAGGGQALSKRSKPATAAQLSLRRQIAMNGEDERSAREQRPEPDAHAAEADLDDEWPGNGLDDFLDEVEEEELGDSQPDNHLADLEEPPESELARMEEELAREGAQLDDGLLDLSSPELANDPVRLYLREIGRVNLLSEEEEKFLARKVQLGILAKRLLEMNTGTDGARRPEGVSATHDGASEVSSSRRETLSVPSLALGSYSELLSELDPNQPDMLKRAVEEGKEAERRLTEANLRLVVSVAKRYIGRGMTLLDLVQEGNIGLLRAVEKFDHRRGYKFSTYATWWIRQAISRAIADQARTIRIPVHMVETINRLLRIQRRLVQELGHEPSMKEIALEMDLLSEEDRQAIYEAENTRRPLDPAVERRWRRAANKVRRIIRIAQEPMSLETPIGTEDNSYLGDFIEDETVLGPVDAASKQLLKEQMQDILDSLSDRERRVLDMRFGLLDGQGRTLEEVGQAFGVTRERIRQIEAKALRKLRHPIRSRKLRDYLS